MNLLLDTHAFLWFSEDSKNLSKTAKSIIEDAENNCFVSIASFWEMAIKISLKKLKISLDFKQLLEEAKRHDFMLLPIDFEHTAELTSMEFHHRDPFDRILIAQSKIANLTLISADEIFDSYDVKRAW
jgi:PIN domain nuclease of toxin-antitoxin system